MKKFIFIAIFHMISFLSINSFSAPMLERAPVTIEGTVREISWNPEEFIKGDPHAWGSARHDRTIPAHYTVTLFDIIVTGKNLGESLYKDGGELHNLYIKRKRNDEFLIPGMRIKVIDFQRRGDEGGDWTYYSSIEIL
jgi:hypothetical protein